jgi:hypothetical protein
LLVGDGQVLGLVYVQQQGRVAEIIAAEQYV